MHLTTLAQPLRVSETSELSVLVVEEMVGTDEMLEVSVGSLIRRVFSPFGPHALYETLPKPRSVLSLSITVDTSDAVEAR